jgi:two-component system, chemotaxis family, chemotaxis protein CheY
MIKKKKVLIYLDFESIRNIVLKQLNDRGFETCVTNSVSETLEQLNGTTIDLFITDNDIKNDVALKIVKHMRDTTSYLFTPIILLITGDKERYLDSFGDLNIAMYLTKPFNINVLNRVLDRLSK